MSDYSDLALGQKLDALNLKIVELQKDVAGLCQDVRKVLFLLKAEQSSAEESEISEPGA